MAGSRPNMRVLVASSPLGAWTSARTRFAWRYVFVVANTFAKPRPSQGPFRAAYECGLLLDLRPCAPDPALFFQEATLQVHTIKALLSFSCVKAPQIAHHSNFSSTRATALVAFVSVFFIPTPHPPPRSVLLWPVRPDLRIETNTQEQMKRGRALFRRKQAELCLLRNRAFVEKKSAI